MKTVILCGGQGTRIRDVAADIPKPMIRIGNYPILWHIMKGYAQWGFNDFVLCLGHQSHVIKEFFFEYNLRVSDLTITLGKEPSVTYLNSQDSNDWRVTLAETGINAMTGARVLRIPRYVNDDDCFMLTYGDGVGDINIKSLVEFHRSHGRMMTVT